MFRLKFRIKSNSNEKLPYTGRIIVNIKDRDRYILFSRETNDKHYTVAKLKQDGSIDKIVNDELSQPTLEVVMTAGNYKFEDYET
jgi:hypothetical protein